MTNFNKHEIESVNDFIQKFVNSALKTLIHNLDKDVYKKIELTISSCSEINAMEALNDGKMFYKLDYSKGDFLGTLGVLIPEELVSNLSDVLTGGNGNNDYEGVLSELELNSIKDLTEKIFDEIENLFKRIYTSDFGFSADPIVLLKEMPHYGNEFGSSEFDFIIDLILKTNGEKEYPIALLLNSSDLKRTLTSLNVFQSESGERPNFHTNINIDHLCDIEIDISAELGTTKIPVLRALELVKGSIVRLDTLNDTDIKVYANNVEVAKAQIVVVGENFGLRITKIITPEERMKLV